MQNLAAISEFITSTATELGLDEAQAFAVQMAIDEAVTNVIEHAYAGRTDGEILIRCSVVDDDVVVTILDHGQPFDPTCVLPPDVTAPLEEQEQ
jgi:anti-sigma regulatory factor (Ser/Thr protein kinase)